MENKVVIELENMKFYAYHGHFEIEQKVGNHFTVCLTVETEVLAALWSDRLKDAVDYQQLHQIVQREMEIPSHLLENVAHRIIQAVFSECQPVSACKVKISKMNPPMGGELEKVSVTIDRKR